MSDKPKGGKRMRMVIILVVVAVCSVGAGIAVPHFLYGGSQRTEEKKAPPKPTEVNVAFGETIVVNLAEGRLNRYLRVKILLVTDNHHEKELNEKLEHGKAALKDYLIGLLSDKTLQEVTGRAGVNRTRREILTHFKSTLFPEGGDTALRNVLFEEFVVQ